MRLITVLSGGVGGARFARALRDATRDDDVEIRLIVNTADDMWLAGLRICPDLDSITYALAGVNDTQRGWGREGDTERVSAELGAWGIGWPWFTLGDLDLGMHIARTSLLRDGLSLTDAVARLTSRWDLGVALVPMTDDEVETHVLTEHGDLHFQEWWTRHRAQLPAESFQYRGVDQAVECAGTGDMHGQGNPIVILPHSRTSLVELKAFGRT